MHEGDLKPRAICLSLVPLLLFELQEGPKVLIFDPKRFPEDNLQTEDRFLYRF